MMLNLDLKIKPYSVNKYYYGNRAIKRTETVEWEINIIELLRTEEVQNQIEEFTNLFNPAHHCIQIDIIYYYPKNILFTQKNELSSRAFDLSNVEKPLIDVLFLEKYSTNSSKNLRIDDKYITDLSSKKRKSEEHKINIKIQLKNLDSLQDI